MSKAAFSKIKAGLDSALRFARGEESARVTTIAVTVDRDGRVRTNKLQHGVLRKRD